MSTFLKKSQHPTIRGAGGMQTFRLYKIQNDINQNFAFTRNQPTLQIWEQPSELEVCWRQCKHPGDSQPDTEKLLKCQLCAGTFWQPVVCWNILTTSYVLELGNKDFVWKTQVKKLFTAAIARAARSSFSQVFLRLMMFTFMYAC